MSEPMCYAGFLACGCMVAAVVDDAEHAKATAKDVADFIRHGYRVERVPVEVVRTKLKACHCTEKPQATMLPGMEDER